MRFAMELMETGEWDLSLDNQSMHRSLRHDIIFGYHELLPQWTYDTFLEHVVPEDRAGVDQAFQAAVATQKNWDIECRIRRRDEVVRWIRAAGRHCQSESGRTNRLIGIIQDITARREAEEERQKVEKKLQETQKLECLGVLAGGIAHDFNNLLTGVIGNASIARMEQTPTSPMLPLLDGIEEAAARAADLCKQMLAYAGKGRFIIQHLNLSTLVKETIYLLQTSIGKGVVLKFNLAEGLPAVSADATQLRQIVMNLVLNASEAIGAKSGFISVTTGLLHADRTYLYQTIFNPELPEGDYVYLEVSDNGGGMTQETLSKIFDPFFTTKFTGRGLGLAAVLGIVRGHNGTLKVYTELGKGTSFKILIPSTYEPATPPIIIDSELDQWRGSGTVLVVDDEEIVRTTATRMLTSMGFTVLTANDGREGIATFKAHAESIRAVVLDLTMPHLDGEATFRELRLLRPEVRVLLVSGFDEQEAVNRFLGKGLAGFLQKPFKMESLRLLIKEMTAGETLVPGGLQLR